MIESVVNVRTNRELIDHIRPLWIDPLGVRILDATFGQGKWWHWEDIPNITSNDLDPNSPSDHHHDFRQFPEEWCGKFDVVAFDPPYIAQGGRETSTLCNTQKDGMLDRYGLHDVSKTHDELAVVNCQGAYECLRVLRPGGILLWKTMDYITSGRYRSGLRDALLFLAAHGEMPELVDLFIHHSGTGPQPKTNRDGSPRRQVHSRRSHSYLVVAQKKGKQ